MFKDFEFVKEALGSPYFFLVVLALMALSPTLYRLFGKKKCQSCKKGTMKEAESQVLENMHYDATSDGNSSSKLRVKVTYRCTHCDAFNEIIENR